MAQDTHTDTDFKAIYPDAQETNPARAAEFLISIAKGNPVTVVCISAKAPPGGKASVIARTFDPGDLDSDALARMRSFIATQEMLQNNVFYVANITDLADRMPGNADMAALRNIVIDFDPDKTKPLEQERDRLRQKAYDVLHNPVKPRAIVNTGGGIQVVYELLKPIPFTADLIRKTEDLMKRLARSQGADTATCSANHLFRVPFTYNWPNEAKEKAGRSKSVSSLWYSGGPRVALEELEALTTMAPTDGPDTAPVAFGDLTRADIIEVVGDRTTLPGHLIELLQDPLILKIVERPPVPEGDRSKDDFIMACALLRRDLSNRDAALIVSACGHKTMSAWDDDRQSGERLYRYVLNTVTKARKQVSLEGMLEDVTDEVDRADAKERRREHLARLKPLTLEQSLHDLFSANHTDMVEGLMRRGELMVLYGKPGSGKTFVALDLSFHIAHGLAWNERKVKPGIVVYIATESPLGIRYRIKALVDRYGMTDNFFLVATTVNMFDPRIDLKPLMDEIAQIDGEIGMIVIDTLARTLIGGNENSTQDMSRLIANGDMLRDRFGATIAWVHHTGKNEAAGARGSSALVAATDTEIEIADLAFRSTKMRDRENVDYRFRLIPSTVGTFPDGTVVNSCTVNWFAGAGEFGQSTPGDKNLGIAVEILRMRGQPLNVSEIFAEAANLGRKFTVKQNSLRMALTRACASDTNQIFTRVESGGTKEIHRYGLVNW